MISGERLLLLTLLWFALLEFTICRKKKGYSFRFLISSRNTTPWFERYSPNFGYEPYWKGGDWLLQTTTVSQGVETTTEPMVCGVYCLNTLAEAGPVCALRPYDHDHARHLYGCWNFWNEHCSGRFVDRQPYVTYENYCKYLEDKCVYGQRLLDATSKNVVFVHRGPCLDNVVPPWDFAKKGMGMFNYLDSRLFSKGHIDYPVLDRVTIYLQQLASRQKHYILTPATKPTRTYD